MGLWNLSVGLAATGCGPLVPIDGETDTDGPNDDDDVDDDDPSGQTDPPGTTLPTTTTSPTDTDPFACDPACPPDYFCVDGACIPDDECYYGSGGYGYCCYDSCCDYDCYYECYAAEECGPGEYCSTNYAECYDAEELGNCEPPATHFIPIPVEAVSGAVALAFGDVQPAAGEELLVVSADEARLVSGGGASATPPVELPGASDGASAAAMVTPSGPAFAVGVPGAGGVQLVRVVGDALLPDAFEAAPLTGIVGADLDGDGFDDIAGLDGNEIVWLRFAGEGFLPSEVLFDDARSPLAVGRFGADGSVDVAAHFGYGPPFVVDAVEGGTQFVYGRAASVMTIAAVDYDADGDEDIVGLTSSAGTMLVLPWQNAGGGDHYVESTRWTNDFGPDVEGLYRVAAGDFDGDGHEDLFVGSPSTIRVLQGSADGQFACVTDVAIPHGADVLAVGDLDADGRADVAFSDGVTTTVIGHD